MLEKVRVMLKKIILWSVAVLLVLFVLIQFIALAGAKTNPPVIAKPTWDSEQTNKNWIKVRLEDTHA